MTSSDCLDSPLTPQAICAMMRRMNLVRQGEPCACEPLSGGVSSDTWRVVIGTERYCLKRALPRLKVAQLWEAPVARNAFEWEWLKLAAEISPNAVPDLVAHDPQAGLFVMQYLDPENYPLWKNQLRDGIVEERTAQAVAERLVRIHAATAAKPDIAQKFATDESFYAIRLEPYLVATGKAHPDLRDRLDALVETTASTQRALVHGDVSPKNILVGPRGPVFIDAECAWYGDPAFDPAFCLNHLLLKCLWRPQHAPAYLACFDHFAATYLEGVSWEPRASIEARIAGLLPALLLARIDGKSPVEYVTAERDKERVRAVARPLIARACGELGAIRRAWAREVLDG
jgi:aminoglycoside phosphotransferase (APT) family kinase protein